MTAEQLFNIKFVQAVESCPILWDMKSRGCRNNRNNKLIQMAWVAVSRKIKEPTDACRERWRNIRNAFLRSMKRSMDDNRIKRQYYLKPYLKFLMPYVKANSDSEDPNATAIEAKKSSISYKDDVDSNYSYLVSNDSRLCKDEVGSNFSDTNAISPKNKKSRNHCPADKLNPNHLSSNSSNMDDIDSNHFNRDERDGSESIGPKIDPKPSESDEKVPNHTITNKTNSNHLITKWISLNQPSSTDDSWDSDQEIEDIFNKLVASIKSSGRNTGTVIPSTIERAPNHSNTDEINSKISNTSIKNSSQNSKKNRDDDIDEDIKPGPFLEDIKLSGTIKSTTQKDKRPKSASTDKSHDSDFQEDYKFFDMFEEAEAQRCKRQKPNDEEESDSDLIFFKSLLRDCRKMTDKQNRKFRLRVLQVVDEIFESKSTENSQDPSNDNKIQYYSL